MRCDNVWVFFWCFRKDKNEIIFFYFKCCIFIVDRIIEVLLRFIVFNKDNGRLDGYLSMKMIDKKEFFLSVKGFFLNLKFFYENYFK